MLQASVRNVLVVLDGCCTCFIWVLHMFHTYVTSVLFGCCMCFTLMLQVFHSDVAYVFNTFPSCFRCMLQVFQLFSTYVTNVFSRCCKVDLVLHMLQRTLSAAAVCCSCWAHLHARGGGTSGRRGKSCGHTSRRSRRGTRSDARHGAGTEHGAAWDPRKADMPHGCPDAGPHPNSSLSFGLVWMRMYLSQSSVNGLLRCTCIHFNPRVLK
jgi:hypothetical protein